MFDNFVVVFVPSKLFTLVAPFFQYIINNEYFNVRLNFTKI